MDEWILQLALIFENYLEIIIEELLWQVTILMNLKLV